MITSSDDALQELMDELISRSNAKGLTLFRGYIHPDQHPLVTWEEGDDDVWAFLDAASDVGARMLYLHSWRFDEGRLDEAVGLVEAQDNQPEAVQAREQLERFRRHVGKVATLTVLFRFDGVFHALTKTAFWFDEFLSLSSSTDTFTVQAEVSEEVVQPRGGERGWQKRPEPPTSGKPGRARGRRAADDR